MKLFFALFSLVYLQSIVVAGEPLSLRFNGELSWKEIFDQGFRPKHLKGLEHSQCYIPRQSIRLFYGDHPDSFLLREGRMSFSVRREHKMSGLSLREQQPMTLEEALIREERFRELLGTTLIKHLPLPKTYDPNHPSFRFSNRSYVAGELGNNHIFLSFLPTRDPETPLVASFSIEGQNHRELMKYLSFDPITPPPGYEDYDLTPPPHPTEIAREKRPAEQGVPESTRSRVNSIEPIETSKPEASGPETHFPWWLVAIVATLLGLIGLRMLNKRRG